MENATPYEIIGAPFEIWIATPGVTFPAVDKAPNATDWSLLGKSGTLSQTQDGVTIEQSQTLNKFRAAGDTGSRKVFRTAEDLMVSAVLADLTVETYAKIMNGNTITTVVAATGVAGTKKMGLSRGLAVDTVALLVRGPSPYMADGVAQYELPLACQSGSPKPVFKNGEAAGLACQFDAIVDTSASDPSEYFGRYIAQTADALP